LPDAPTIKILRPHHLFDLIAKCLLAFSSDNRHADVFASARQQMNNDRITVVEKQLNS
jgi:hypothetical protein